VLPELKPRIWKKLEAMIVQNAGSQTIAPISDKRPAIVVTTAEQDFSDLL